MQMDPDNQRKRPTRRATFGISYNGNKMRRRDFNKTTKVLYGIMYRCMDILRFVDNSNQSWRKDWNIGERYVIQRILGNGSYGDVAKAIDTHTNEIVKIVFEWSEIGGDQKDCPHVRRFGRYKTCIA